MSASSLQTVPAVGDVVGITEAVWTSFLGETAVGVVDAPRIGPAEGDTVSAYVLVGGAWRGGIVLSCGSPAARQLACAMLGITGPVDDADMDDAVGELANMLGGNVKSLVPQPSAISLPVVTGGTTASGFEPADAQVICRLELLWQGNTISLQVWTQDEQHDGTGQGAAPSSGGAGS